MQSPTTASPDVHPDVERFAAWMAGSAAGGARLLADAKPAGDLATQLRAIVELLPRSAEPTDLDVVLRTDPTAVMDMQHPLIRGEQRRLFVLQRQLQRTCLAATLGRLPRDQRAVFILLAIMRFSKEETAAILGKPVSAIVVHKTRSLREVDNYVGPRCEHMDPANLCHCSTRLAIALDRGFVGWPGRDDVPDGPLVVRRHADVAALYATLSPPG